jgi:hypothetical protein
MTVKRPSLDSRGRVFSFLERPDLQKDGLKLNAPRILNRLARYGKALPLAPLKERDKYVLFGVEENIVDRG